MILLGFFLLFGLPERDEYFFESRAPDCILFDPKVCLIVIELLEQSIEMSAHLVRQLVNYLALIGAARDNFLVETYFLSRLVKQILQFAKPIGLARVWFHL